MKRIKKYSLLLILAVGLFSCTKLHEEFRSNLEEGDEVPSSQLLVTAYEAMNGPYQQDNVWVLQEITSDEAIAPTRGGDWDDNGIYRALQLHTWTSDNSFMNNTYLGLGTLIFRASDVLAHNPTKQEAAEARFIRAMGIFNTIDLWGMGTYREDLSDFKIAPIKMNAEEGLMFIIDELNEIMNDLPTSGSAYVASQSAARTLLMKIYLNKGAFINRSSPTFDQSDMNKVVELADQITGYTISKPGHYFDNFAPRNDQISTENIFTLFNQEGIRGGSVNRTYNTIAHYNMTPGGWNGWATIGTFYDKFEQGDERRGIYYHYPEFDESRPNPRGAVNAGFLAGQQYDYITGEALMARNPSTQPLDFSYNVTLRTAGNTLETAGIRVLKYPYDYSSQTDQKNNDWVVFRYADVLLMKAEAIMRGATNANETALDIVNEIRKNRSATQLTSLSLDNLLDERGRELYWEGWRRQDLIRFGKFLKPWVTKPDEGAVEELLFAFPSQQIAVDPDLIQNPGY